MKIGELARVTGLSTSRIRFYEDAGLIGTAPRLRNGYRDYPTGVAASLRMIQQAQSFGFSLAEIRAAMRIKVPQGRHCDHVLRLLQTKLEQVDRHLSQMDVTRTRLRGQIAALQQAGRSPL